MVRQLFFILLFLLLVGCSSSRTHVASKRGLMLVEAHELPRNAKFASKRYQQNLKSRQKKQKRKISRSYRRAQR